MNKVWNQVKNNKYLKSLGPVGVLIGHSVVYVY